MGPIAGRPIVMLGGLALVLAALAMLRPLDHDESQYVAAAVLSARGWLPYRDYAYLQAPLQPLLLAPVAWIAGAWTWPALRVVNALLGAGAVAGVWCATRVAGAGDRAALIAAGLFASCDIVLFSIGTARNDALPATLFAWALPAMLRATRGEATRGSAALAGLLLAAAAAAKVSYALPAVTYGAYALIDRRHRPSWVAAGAAPLIALTGALAALAPPAFSFEVFGFPSYAPTEYYVAQGRAWKLSWAVRGFDSLKFLALGPALLAAGVVLRDRRRNRAARLLGLLIAAGVVAALLPAPTWRQYWLPALMPLFVRLGLAWDTYAPRRMLCAAAIVFAGAGLAPSLEALVLAVRGVPMIAAMRDGAAIRAALDGARVAAPIATLSPQFLPATGRPPDPRFAPGPFYFRGHGLLDRPRERAFGLIARGGLGAGFAPPAAILIGGEGPWTSGDAALDTVLERWAIAHRYRALPVAGGRFRLYVTPR